MSASPKGPGVPHSLPSGGLCAPVPGSTLGSACLWDRTAWTAGLENPDASLCHRRTCRETPWRAARPLRMGAAASAGRGRWPRTAGLGWTSKVPCLTELRSHVSSSTGRGQSRRGVGARRRRRSCPGLGVGCRGAYQRDGPSSAGDGDPQPCQVPLCSRSWPFRCFEGREKSKNSAQIRTRCCCFFLL